MERQHIVRTLEYTNGSMVEAARLLGISRSTLYNKLAHFGLRN
jgi:transcriptional regulator of acetoin/glycerol metabolism